MAENKEKFLVKKCPFCATPLKAADKVCFSCKHKVGPVNKVGVATIPGRWKAYVWLAGALGLAYLYFRWAFFG